MALATQGSLAELKVLLSRYFIGLILQISILLLIYTLVLVIFKVPNAFVIALLCALLNLVLIWVQLLALLMLLQITVDMVQLLFRNLFPKHCMY